MDDIDAKDECVLGRSLVKKNTMSDNNRLAALRSTDLLDSAAEERFDRLTRLASRALGTEMALVSLIDSDRQWFKSRHGLRAQETRRDLAFCDHTIRDVGVMVVPDAKKDTRFHENALVTGDPNIAFYAGAPLITRDGYALGTLCVLDTKPREDFSEEDKQILYDIAQTVMLEIEAHTQEQIIDDLNLVNQELQHRMGNMYAHVSSLVSLMERNASDSKDFAKRLRKRISTLAQTQALIASQRYENARFQDIVENTMSPFVSDDASSRIRFAGDSNLLISPRGAFTVTLMINELASNATKHGALSRHDGKIDIFWSNTDRLNFSWKESFDRTNQSTPSRKGFGTQILTRIVPLDLRGSSRMNFAENGLEYILEANLARLIS
jgi:two-component sensor histidine kinase